ncbi:FlgD immunoglobulin-like domain containing protein [Reichenbachiella ulvae]|uniref:T9SS type A sorting domain-containing protein n=1 Tax=Reichenbachiella ulvae TaxID=2980104 RepID=A0ABT3CNS6_9BACT|nr:FlgD immunoglobulin-like domain containing protein [Reichenbachiella ulvae]MCV9385341.1 T9SS type A sorting domain-containing protein [Reichenbachiella ulvae]
MIKTCRAFTSAVGIFLFILVFSCTAPETQEEVSIEAPHAIGSKENPQARLEFEMMQLVDPATGRLPININHDQLAYAARMQSEQPQARRLTQDWNAKGPANVGGRTRALAVDVTDEDVLLAGGVSGGMYRSTDQGNSWTRTTHPSILNSISCITQDKRPGHENVWYYGTGELRGNSPRATGAPYRGDGIYKSTDGGLSWDILPSTSNNRLTDFESPFNYVWSIEVDPNGVIYAALYGCVVKSEDDGVSWEVVLGPDLLNPQSLDPPITDLNDSEAPFYTSLLQTPSGTLYAALSAFTSLGYRQAYAGIYQRESPNNWVDITPTQWSDGHDRTVMAYAPTDEEVIYTLSDGRDLELWKRKNNLWQNRSMNLPGLQDTLPSLDTQESYNMVIKVHPENENVVFAGGTNLYRSSDGFATSNNSRWIGGYNPGPEEGNLYPGHHPDQHELVFLPSDPNTMFSANDGGVRLTRDNLADKVSWTAKNEGYVTSQFYTIALSQQEGSLKALGGMQDNGTYLKILGSDNSTWRYLLGGDGSYVATTPNDTYWYASFQSGSTFRLSLNNSNELVSFAEVDPVGGEGYLFINPFVLDPNNFNRMYMAGGNVIWRNDNLSQVPSGKQQPTPINWSKIESTESEVGAVSAMAISTRPGHVLYWGTSYGAVFKTIYANTDSAETFFLFQHVVTDEGGNPSSGYISNVSVNPSNADQVLFSYANYHFPSLFYSEDGGATFTDVGGNLEENPDGSGSGPSVRWNQIIPLADGSSMYFTATSTGLYSTRELNGASTVWVKEGDETIGNSVIRMMDYRSSDGTFIVATHGNGVFETTIETPESVLPESGDVSGLQIVKGYPNPFEETIKIQFKIPEEDRVVVHVLNSSGQLIKSILDSRQFAGDVQVSWDGTNVVGGPVDDGLYFYRIYYQGKMKSGKMLYFKK